MIKLNTKYSSSEGIITILRKDEYKNEFGKTFKYLYICSCGTKVDEFVENSTFAKSLNEI